MKEKIFIIAEAGVNHNGDMELARKLITVAAEAGADAVKFQTFKAERLVTQAAEKAQYQKETSGADESQFAMIKKLELDIAAHTPLIEHCKEEGILFLSTAFDEQSADDLYDLGIRIFKIPSGEITNLPYLRKIGQMHTRDENGCDVILSTGMSTLDDIADALFALEQSGTPLERITVLHCNTQYPTPYADVNLTAMEHIQEEFPRVKVGYSDHTLGIEVPIAAAAQGAELIEKHFTLDSTMEGPDHKASLEPEALKQMVTSVRNIELAMGDGEKKVSPSEAPNIVIARKFVVAAQDIAEGETFTADNLTVKRTGKEGVSPMLWDSILGSTATRKYTCDEMIEFQE
ncbi:MAG: N-acetylneuraminate synthase [Desulfovibrio sp.]